jgi:hypothetical protein
MLTNADEHIARFLMKEAVAALPAPKAPGALGTLLRLLAAPALLGGAIGGARGMIGSEDSPVSSGLLGALTGAGLGAAGGLAGGVAGGHIGRLVGSKQVPRIPAAEKATMFKDMTPGLRRILATAKLHPYQMTLPQAAGVGWGIPIGGLVGGGLGGLVGGGLAQ